MIELLLVAAVTISMLVGWWRGRGSIGLGNVHRILAADGVKVTGTMRVTSDRTIFEARWQRGSAWCQVDFDLNEESVRAFVQIWLRNRGAP